MIAEVAAEAMPQPAFGDSHAHAVSEALAERPCGYFHAGKVPGFGVARGRAAPLAEAADVFQAHGVAGEMEHRIKQDRSMARAEDEAIPVGPVGMGGVVSHYPMPQHMS